MIENRSMPPGIVIPTLPYPDIVEAARWLCDHFGFIVRIQMGDHRAQLTTADGSGSIVLVKGSPGHAAVMVRVEDAAALAAKLGAETADYPFGERQFTVRDFAGHSWTFSQSIADVDPASWLNP